MNRVFVLHYDRKDKKGHGVETVFEDEQRANEAFELLEKYDSDRDWFIDVYEVK